MESQGQPMRYECIVHKANVPLAKGESLGSYTNALSQDSRAYIMKQLNLNSLSKTAPGVNGAGVGCYMIEAYGDKAVFNVYKYGGNEASTDKFYAIKYTRKSDGKFDFSDLSEVQRVVSFQPKSTLEVTKGKKAAPPEDGEEEDDEELSAKKPKKKTTKEFAPGWESANKAGDVWDGIL